MFWPIRSTSPQRFDELLAGLEAEARRRRRSFRFPHGGGGMAREVG